MAKDAARDTFYDHFAQDRPTKFGMCLVRAVSKKIFRFAQIKKGGSVLEIGPGRGIFADVCLSAGAEYWAIEPNVKMADDLEKRGAKVLRNIVPPIPEIGRSYDTVVMNSVMEHMDTMSAALELSKQVYQLLNPRGRFVIYVPDYANWKHHFFQGDFSHNYVTSWRRMEGLLISAGFENIKGIYLSGPFRGVVCFLISAAVPLLPFGWFDTMFPKAGLLHKLYKLQVSFLRRVLILGEKALEN